MTESVQPALPLGAGPDPDHDWERYFDRKAEETDLIHERIEARFYGEAW